jgi:hypothetical protein
MIRKIFVDKSGLSGRALKPLFINSSKRNENNNIAEKGKPHVF